VGDLLLWATMLIACGGLGLPLARALPARLAWRALLAPTFGSAVLAIVVPIAYRFGASMRVLLVASVAVSLGIIASHVRLHGVPRGRNAKIVVGVWLVAALLLLAPRWIGGDQFAVFQGNYWDTYGYLDSAMAYATRSYHSIHDAGQLQLLRNPFFAIAQSQLGERPSVHELYAMFSRVEPGHAYRLYYAFLVFFMGQVVLVGMFVARNALPRANVSAWIAIAVVFPLGFWGQYVVDINAWSQIAATPLLFALFGLALHIPAMPSPREAWRLAAGLALAVAGAVYVYPEGFLIYVVALAPVATVSLVIAMVRARRFDASRLIPLCGVMGIAAAGLYPPVLHFLIRQVTWTAGTNVPWWQFFQRFFVGRDDVWGAGFGRVADFVASLLGGYFATPTSADDWLQRVIVLVAVAGVILGVAQQLRARDPAIVTWVATGLLLLVPAVYLAHRGNYWAAGKVVSYAAPVFVTALCLPLAGSSRWRWFAGAYVVLQLCTAFARVPAAADGVGFAPPYPAVQGVGNKVSIGWNLQRLEPLLDEHSKVTIHPSDPWTENNVMVFLTSRAIPWVKQSPVTATPGGAPIGTMPMPWLPTVELTYAGDAIVLTYADGRPEVRVSTR
jgi:hypothetical protein